MADEDARTNTGNPKSDGARYEAVAEWYVEFTRDWERPLMALLAGPLAGQRVLDLACGYGRATRELARLGAEVTGVELSGAMLRHACAIETAKPLGIAYAHGDVSTTDWWNGVPFDGAVCNMALMDIDDLHAVLRSVASVLVDDGWFTFSVVHPCFPGGEDGSKLPSWPPERGYAWEGWWTTGADGVRGRVGATHRTLSTYLNAVIDAGFTFERFAEPATRVPTYFVAACRRRSRTVSDFLPTF